MTGAGAPRRPVRAVTFDFWHTLVVPLDEVTAGYRARRLEELAAEEAGHVVSDDLALGLTAAAAAREAHTTTWLAGETDHWDATADAVAVALGLPAGERRLRDAVEGILGSFPDGRFPQLTGNVAATVRALADAGIPLGIVCDVGLVPAPLLRACLDHHGLLDAFAHTSFSDEVGAFKPDARIFGHALAGLGHPDPSAAAHVGDLRRTDVAGARAMGMTAVRYTGSNDDPGRAADGTAALEAHHVVADHAELPVLLGVGG